MTINKAHNRDHSGWDQCNANANILEDGYNKVPSAPKVFASISHQHTLLSLLAIELPLSPGALIYVNLRHLFRPPKNTPLTSNAPGQKPASRPLRPFPVRHLPPGGCPHRRRRKIPRSPRPAQCCTSPATGRSPANSPADRRLTAAARCAIRGKAISRAVLRCTEVSHPIVEMGPGCVKTPKLNLRIGISSRLRQFEK